MAILSSGFLNFLKDTRAREFINLTFLTGTRGCELFTVTLQKKRSKSVAIHFRHSLCITRVSRIPVF